MAADGGGARQLTPAPSDAFPRHPFPVVLEPKPTRHENTELEDLQLMARNQGLAEHAPEIESEHEHQ